VIDITDTVGANLRRIAAAEERSVEDLTVVVLDRDRHEGLLEEIRRAGARVKLIMDREVNSFTECGSWGAAQPRTAW
jgi:fructose-1,6-bisphosphatase II